MNVYFKMCFLTILSHKIYDSLQCMVIGFYTQCPLFNFRTNLKNDDHVKHPFRSRIKKIAAALCCALEKIKLC